MSEERDEPVVEVPTREDIDPDGIGNAALYQEEEDLADLSDIEELEWQIRIGKRALAKYRRLMRTRDLNLDEERMMLSHQDSIRKLRMSLAQLKAKEDTSKLKEHEVAERLIQGGMDPADVGALYMQNPEVQKIVRKYQKKRKK